MSSHLFVRHVPLSRFPPLPRVPVVSPAPDDNAGRGRTQKLKSKKKPASSSSRQVQQQVQKFWKNEKKCVQWILYRRDSRFLVNQIVTDAKSAGRS